MNRVRRVAYLIFLCTMVAACGQGGTGSSFTAGGMSPSASPSQVPTSHPGRKAPPPVPIPWDDPEGLNTDLAHADAVGQLPFPATDPHFGRSPALVRVADPSGTPARGRHLTMLFRFPVGSTEFPTDGRLLLTEMLPDVDATTLASMVFNRGPRDLSYEAFSVSGGGTGMLLTNTENGHGRVLLLWHGLKYDLDGPAVPASTVRMLTEKLVGSPLSSYAGPLASPFDR